MSIWAEIHQALLYYRSFLFKQSFYKKGPIQGQRSETFKVGKSHPWMKGQKCKQLEHKSGQNVKNEQVLKQLVRFKIYSFG